MFDCCVIVLWNVCLHHREISGHDEAWRVIHVSQSVDEGISVSLTLVLSFSFVFIRTCRRTADSSCSWRRASTSSRPTRMSSPSPRVTSSAWLVRRTAAGGRGRSAAGLAGSLATMSVRSKALVGSLIWTRYTLNKASSASCVWKIAEQLPVVICLGRGASSQHLLTPVFEDICNEFLIGTQLL